MRLNHLVSLLLAICVMVCAMGMTAVAFADENSFTMFMRGAYINWIKELKWYDVGEERTGIHVDYIMGPEEASDTYSEVDQRILSGTLPDVVMTKLSQTNVYGPDGVFVDLAPYIAKYAPNLQAYIDANPDYRTSGRHPLSRRRAALGGGRMPRSGHARQSRAPRALAGHELHLQPRADALPLARLVLPDVPLRPRP